MRQSARCPPITGQISAHSSSMLQQRRKDREPNGSRSFLAVAEGFEPSVRGCRTKHFECFTFGRSDTLPNTRATIPDALIIPKISVCPRRSPSVIVHTVPPRYRLRPPLGDSAAARAVRLGRNRQRPSWVPTPQIRLAVLGQAPSHLHTSSKAPR